jgi:hypothetical protein
MHNVQVKERPPATRRSPRGISKPQGAFQEDTTPRPCQGCARYDVQACLRCGHSVCRACAQLVQDCPLCLAVDACCSSCAGTRKERDDG